MKKSKYIKFVNDNDNNLLYICNLISHAVLSFPKDSMQLINHILNYPNIDYENNLIEEIKKLLFFYRFLIDDNFDELENLRERYTISKSERNTFSIQIANTLQCNFRCLYCYESHEQLFLSKEKQDALIKFVIHNIYKWNKLCISWFGGEPLLRPDIIKYISETIMKICNEYSTHFEGFITTNGYLLNRKNAELLRSCKIKEAQITIDGDKKTHDTRRCLSNGKGTYDTILKNIFENHKYFERLRIRINIDSQSISNIIDVIDKLDAIKQKTWLSFMPVQTVDGCNNKVLSYYEYLSKVKGLNDLAVKRGYRVSPGHRLSGATYCGAYDEQYMLVDARGDVHKCVVTVGKHEYRAGFLEDDGNVIFISNSRHIWNFDPFEDNECRFCECFPICMGGCQNLSVDKKQESGRCSIKDNLSRNLLSLIEIDKNDNIVGNSTY